jgi:hypothetical protein
MTIHNFAQTYLFPPLQYLPKIQWIPLPKKVGAEYGFLFPNFTQKALKIHSIALKVLPVLFCVLLDGTIGLGLGLVATSVYNPMAFLYNNLYARWKNRSIEKQIDKEKKETLSSVKQILLMESLAVLASIYLANSIALLFLREKNVGHYLFPKIAWLKISSPLVALISLHAIGELFLAKRIVISFHG